MRNVIAGLLCVVVLGCGAVSRSMVMSQRPDGGVVRVTGGSSTDEAKAAAVKQMAEHCAPRNATIVSRDLVQVGTASTGIYWGYGVSTASASPVYALDITYVCG